MLARKKSAVFSVHAPSPVAVLIVCSIVFSQPRMLTAKTKVTGAVVTWAWFHAALASAAFCWGSSIRMMRQGCMLWLLGAASVSAINSFNVASGIGSGLNFLVVR